MKKNAWERWKDGCTAVEFHLDNWARWQRGHTTKLGYPTRALVATGGGQSVSGVFEEMCDEADRCAAEIMEALINGLHDDHKNAIYHHWLGCTLRVKNQFQALNDAYILLEAGMNKRGVL